MATKHATHLALPVVFDKDSWQLIMQSEDNDNESHTPDSLLLKGGGKRGNLVKAELVLCALINFRYNNMSLTNFHVLLYFGPQLHSLYIYVYSVDLYDSVA